MKGLAIQLAPEYMELFHEIQEPDGWRTVADGFREARTRLKLDGYVKLYASEGQLHTALLLGTIGSAGIAALERKIDTASVDAQRSFLDSFVTKALNTDSIEEIFPGATDQLKKHYANPESLSTEEREKAVQQTQHLAAFTIALFYNTIAVMVHGEKLTSLVPKALAGDDAAFLKAIHVDKTILFVHPYFKERHDRAQSQQEDVFLRGIGYRLRASPTKGKIRSPGLYLIFAMLHALNWLDDFRHDEILDIFQDARLDIWDPPIDDVNYVTKRLKAYRRMQKSKGLSMQ